MAAGRDEVEEILRAFGGGFGPGYAELVEAERVGLLDQRRLQLSGRDAVGIAQKSRST
jgi:hypothetical protein